MLKFPRSAARAPMRPRSGGGAAAERPRRDASEPPRSESPQDDVLQFQDRHKYSSPPTRTAAIRLQCAAHPRATAFAAGHTRAARRSVSRDRARAHVGPASGHENMCTVQRPMPFTRTRCAMISSSPSAKVRGGSEPSTMREKDAQVTDLLARQPGRARLSVGGTAPAVGADACRDQFGEGAGELVPAPFGELLVDDRSYEAS